MKPILTQDRSKSIRKHGVSFGVLTAFFTVTSTVHAGISVTLSNPLKSSIEDIPELLVAVLNIVITIAIPIIVLFIIFAGFQYVTARGNAEQTKKASQALFYAIIGGVIIIGAAAITAIIKNVVAAF